MLYIYVVERTTSNRMPRRRTTVTIDEEAIGAIRAMATEVGATFPRYLETLMVSHAKERGKLPEDYSLIGETRGGDRTSNAQEVDRSISLLTDSA